MSPTAKGGIRGWLGIGPAAKGSVRIRNRGPGRQRGPGIKRIEIAPPRLESVDTRLTPATRLQPAMSWAYQLQKISADKIAACPADVVVIDPAADGAPDGAFTADQVARMKRRPAGPDKKLLAYLSIGEAEEGRYYWNKAWLDQRRRPTASAPAWLGDRNEVGWDDNHNVRYWDPDWQKLIVDNADSSLNRIIRAGFDGVYLDIVDGFLFWKDDARGGKKRPTADAEMVDFVCKIAAHARAGPGRSDFAIVPQNGEELLAYPSFLATISAIGKEDIFFDDPDHNPLKPNIRARSEAEVESTLDDLRLALAARVPILAVEYLRDRPQDTTHIRATCQHMREHGFIPHFGKRLLAELSETEPPLAVVVG